MAPLPLLQSLLDALDEPALLIERGTVRLANRAAEAVLGTPLAGSDVRLAIRHPQALDQLLSGTAGDCEVRGIGGFERPWLLSIRKLDGGAMLVRLVDRGAAVATERMRVDFVANASHELRTPLSNILGYAETLAEEPELEPGLRARFAAAVRSEAQRMVTLIEDLMNLSRIESGRFVAPSDEVGISDVIARSIANLRTVAGTGACRIDTDVEEGLPPVRGDRAQLVQLLDNLLTNALHYGCGAGQAAIRVAARAERDSVCVSVADDGPGIPRQHLPRLTERFYRVDPARSRESGGTGLGLAIVKHIVERHRGSLDIDSVEGEGTRVVVHLPAVPPE